MKKQQAGFTLIELVMVIVILGILAASFAPKFVDLGTDALIASKAASSGAVKSGLTIAIADLKDNPTVTQLATYVQGGAVADDELIANGGGSIDITIDGVPYEVPTFNDATCSTRTTTGEKVLCVGDIP